MTLATITLDWLAKTLTVEWKAGKNSHKSCQFFSQFVQPVLFTRTFSPLERQFLFQLLFPHSFAFLFLSSLSRLVSNCSWQIQCIDTQSAETNITNTAKTTRILAAFILPSKQNNQFWWLLSAFTYRRRSCQLYSFSLFLERFWNGALSLPLVNIQSQSELGSTTTSTS